MSIDLVAEVLDHYHGPHARKLWLIAWAEKVPRGSRAGYCKRSVLAARLDVSMSRVSGIARELEDEGALKRLGGGVWGKAAMFELSPLDDAQGQSRADPMQGQPRADPTGAPEPHAQGQPRADAQGQPRADPNRHNRHNRQEPSRAREASRPPNRDPRLVLLGLDETVTDAEAEAIAAELEADPDIRDPFAYLLAISAAGADQIGEFLGRMRRQLPAQDPGTGPPKPPWCGECDEQTRLVDREGDHPARCIRCHPLSVKPDDPSPSAWPP